MYWKRYRFAPDMSVFSGGTHTPFPHVENSSVRTGVGLGFLLQPELPVQFAPAGALCAASSERPWV